MGEREHPQADADRQRIEAEFLERLQQEMSKMTVQDHLLHLLRSLPSMAFQHMGIYQPEGSKDLVQARLAIDAFRVLLDVVAPIRAPEEVTMYRSTLAQMQMAYVTAGQGETQPAAAEGTTGSADAPGASAGAVEDDEVPEALYEEAEPGTETDEPAQASPQAEREAAVEREATAEPAGGASEESGAEPEGGPSEQSGAEPEGSRTPEGEESR
jgi:hypothetical protein